MLREHNKFTRDYYWVEDLVGAAGIMVVQNVQILRSATTRRLSLDIIDPSSSIHLDTQ